MAAPTAPKRGISQKLRTVPKTRARTVFTVFSHVFPVIMIITSVIPIPALTRLSKDRIASATEPAVKSSPKTDRIGLEKSTVMKNIGKPNANVHLVMF